MQIHLENLTVGEAIGIVSGQIESDATVPQKLTIIAALQAMATVNPICSQFLQLLHHNITFATMH